MEKRKIDVNFVSFAVGCWIGRRRRRGMRLDAALKERQRRRDDLLISEPSIVFSRRAT
jgi:hypothetical protein